MMVIIGLMMVNVNHPNFDGIHHPCMVKLVLVYDCFTSITLFTDPNIKPYYICVNINTHYYKHLFTLYININTCFYLTIHPLYHGGMFFFICLCLR